MKKKIVIPKNYLENIPKRTDIKWEKDDGGLVTLIVENKGWINRIAQVFFKRPKFSNIHLPSIKKEDVLNRMEKFLIDTPKIFAQDMQNFCQ